MSALVLATVPFFVNAMATRVECALLSCVSPYYAVPATWRVVVTALVVLTAVCRALDMVRERRPFPAWLPVVATAVVAGGYGLSSRILWEVSLDLAMMAGFSIAAHVTAVFAAYWLTFADVRLLHETPPESMREWTHDKWAAVARRTAVGVVAGTVIATVLETLGHLEETGAAALAGSVAALVQTASLPAITRPRRIWFAVTILGWMGAVALTNALETFLATIEGLSFDGAEVVGGAVLGFVQWLVVRRHLRSAGLWVAMVFVVWTVCWPLAWGFTWGITALLTALLR